MFPADTLGFRLWKYWKLQFSKPFFRHTQFLNCIYTLTTTTTTTWTTMINCFMSNFSYILHFIIRLHITAPSASRVLVAYFRRSFIDLDSTDKVIQAIIIFKRINYQHFTHIFWEIGEYKLRIVIINIKYSILYKVKVLYI